MNIEKVKQGIELAKLLNGDEKCECPNGEIRIVILQRGWVYVGKFYQEGPNCKLENAKNIRNWGTTKGLGEIAMNGPTDKTVLDDSPTVKFHELTVVASLVCEDKKWEKLLK
mgnify:CR=1 FL=1